MRLSDSDDDTPVAERGEYTPAESGTLPPEPADEELTPDEYVAEVADLLERDPDAAGDAVGDLFTIAHDDEGATRVAAGEALDAIGRRYPDELAVWSELLAEAASDADDEVAFFALRALAQLAAVSPQAAAKGRKAALDTLGAPDPDLRQAALSVVAEVGPSDPDAVRRADRPLSAALAADDPAVRTAAAIAAGRLLGAAPGKFPRTATALIDALADEDDRVRKYAILALANFASEHPDNVPSKERAIAALASVTDDDLGLRRGATGEALSALVSLTFEEDAATG